VADRISCFCEAILDIPSLCKKNLRCCVAKKIFGSDNTPKELIFPKEDSRCRSGGSSKQEEEDTEDEEIMDTAESKINVAKEKEAREKERKEKERKEMERKEKERKEKEAKKRKEEMEKKNKKKKKDDEQKPPGPEGRCRGTCVTGFFSLLCDEIDRAAACPGQVTSFS
jgi:hypothetical protein